MRILLITPNFFDYPEIIVDGLKKIGHEVDWFDDRPSVNSFVKAAIRMNSRLVYPLVNKYFKKVLSETSQRQYDKFILVSGQSLSFDETMIKKFKESQPNAEFILYQWDSQKNFKRIVPLQKYFDRCYSFDPQDAFRNNRLTFLPLFYSDRYKRIGKKSVKEFNYDLMFVGTAHPKKYKFINEISKELRGTFKKQYIYFFLPSRLVFLYRKLRDPEFRDAKYSEFHYRPLRSRDLDRVLSGSYCVIDSAQKGQLGLTIRVIETLGAKRKIITTNPDIKNYDFFSEENCYVYDGKSFDLKNPFFVEPYKELSKDIYDKYSISSWLKEILGEKNELS